MLFTIENLNLISSSLKEKQFYVFYPNLKDQINTGIFSLDSETIKIPVIGKIRTDYCLSKYSSINRGGKLLSSSKISFNHMIFSCRLGFQLKALPKFAKKNLTALIVNKSIKNWAYKAYLEGGSKILLKKPPFFSKLWKNLEANLHSGKIQEIKIFPLYGGWTPKVLTSSYRRKKKEFLSLVFGVRGSLINKDIKRNIQIPSKKIQGRLKKKIFKLDPNFQMKSYSKFTV
jgi:hypothetical protein